MKKYAIKSIVEILERVEGLYDIIRIHKSQINPDILAIDGYQKLKFQYSTQIKELLHEFDIEVEIHGQVA
jgi:hypothetical protein